MLGRQRHHRPEIVGEEYFPLDHTDYAPTIERILSSGTEVVFNTTVPPGLTHAARFPGPAQFTGGSACSGLYCGLKLWQAAVKEAGSLDEGAVIRALDHARIGEGPGGPSEMVPGQHHVRMNMYIARARGGRFEVVEPLGVVEPKERPVAEHGARAAE